MDERTRTSGKWSQSGVPHKGWICVDTEDLGNPKSTCEMCETQEIRFIHYMQHAKYSEILGCGCICAGRMEEDYAGAKQRETVLRNASTRRKNWLRKVWKVSQNGNPYIKANGYHVVVYPAGAVWAFRITNVETKHARTSKRPLASMEAAKLKAFDAIVWMKDRGE